MRDRRQRRYRQAIRRSWTMLLFLALLAGACGSDDGSNGTSADGGADRTSAPAATTGATTGTTGEATTGTGGPTTTPGQSCTPPPETTGSTTSAPTTNPTTTEATTAQTTTVVTSDPQVAGHQQRLTDLGYWLGPVDGQLGSKTAHAVTAFQKAEGLPRTGRLGAVTLDRLAIASTPAASSSEPASHGCVRLTYAAIDDLWASGVAPVGTTVVVY